MKTKTTMKLIRNNWKNIYQCGYCELQNIMNGIEPDHYTCGVYGWNCDIYCNFEYDIAITTGYRGMTGKHITNDIIKKYDDIARGILSDYTKTNYDKTMEKLSENRQDFFKALMEV